MKKLIFILFTICVIAQEKEEQKEQQPFDLPETIIYGKDYISIQAGVKQYPDDTPILSKLELDSLNSLEKQQSLLLPKENLPKSFNAIVQENGYIKGDFGRFTSSEFEAGLAFNINKFLLFAQTGMDISAGHIDNAEFTRLYGKLYSDYVADDKFWVFGGSKTRSSLNLQLNRYNHYSVFNPNNRSLFNSDLGINTDGNYNGFDFKTGLNFSLNTFDDDSLNTNSRAIGAYLSIFNPLNKFRLGFNSRVEFRNELEQNNNHFNIGGTLGFVNRKVNFKAEVSFDLMNADTITRSAPRLELLTDLKINNKNTIKLKAKSGLNRNIFDEKFNQNPYLHLQSQIDHSYSIADVDLKWQYHSTKDLSIMIGPAFQLADRNLNWVNLDSVFFAPTYLDGTVLSLSIESYYQLGKSDKFDFFFKWQTTNADSTEKQFTYIPQINSEIAWNRKWTNNFNSVLSAEYVGERFVDIENINTLDAFVNVQLSINYRIFPKLMLRAKAENLANQNIYIYNFFIERGVFGSVGVVWNF